MILRAPMAVGAAALLTTSLFYGMNQLITSDEISVWTDPGFVIVDTRIPVREIEPPVRQLLPERPLEFKQPDIPRDDYVPGPLIQYSTPALTLPGPTPSNSGSLFPNDRGAQPLVRHEPNFGNVTKSETVVLVFDVAKNGAVIKNSILIIDSSNTRLNREASRTVARWKYQPKMQDGNAIIQRGVRVKFNIQSPQ